MSVSAAYLAVVLIWSTTPLGIVWSSESVHPTMAVLLRMLIAFVCALVLMKVGRISLPWQKQAHKLYAYSGLGIFGGMLLSYFAAAYISSGMMSLIFGLAPILSGVLAQRILNEPKFNWSKRFAMVVAFTGLAIVCADNISMESDGIIGLVLIFSAVILFSISGVLVKSVEISIHPVATTVGALGYTLPLFFLAWLLSDGTLPVEQWQPRSLWAIFYLGVFGSLIGFIAYFYVLQKLKATTVALVTMITPAMAISLGALLNNEPLGVDILLGGGLILLGLMCYHFGDKLLPKLGEAKNEQL